VQNQEGEIEPAESDQSTHIFWEVVQQFRDDVVKNASNHVKKNGLIKNNQRAVHNTIARPRLVHYTVSLSSPQGKHSFQQLRSYNGKLQHDNWFRVAFRPFILFIYPAVLWSSVVYACSIGWLIVISESISVILCSKDTYNFSALSAGLVYISPFFGGIFGTAIAGKVSDIIVWALARRNNWLYEPEFHHVMA
jgi:hypothetical protein